MPATAIHLHRQLLTKGLPPESDLPERDDDGALSDVMHAASGAPAKRDSLSL
jgi:hypothetical protein